MYRATTGDYFGVWPFLQANKSAIKVAGVGFFLVLEAFNYWYYGNKERRNKLTDRYKANRLDKTLKMWMLIPLGSSS